VVRHGTQEEAEGDHAAQEPRGHLLEARLDGRQLPDRDHSDQREHQRPGHVDPDLDSEDAGDRDAHHARRAARRPDCHAVRIAAPSTTTPTAIAVSDQNASGKSWTSFDVAGSNEYVPALKNTRWKTSNAASKATIATTPRTAITTASPRAPFRTA